MFMHTASLIYMFNKFPVNFLDILIFDISANIKRFTYIEMERASHSFADSHKIGSGASSDVYRGQMRDGRPVAIKRLKMDQILDVDSKFSDEVSQITAPSQKI